MSILTNAETALLGLLCEEPMHAWGIQREVLDRDMRFWTDLAQSTIYAHLGRLLGDGLVRRRQEVAGGRARNVYSITGAGRRALREKLRVLLSEPEHVKWRVDLGAYNIDQLPTHERVSCLEGYRTKLGELIDGYRQLDVFMESSGCPAHHRAVAKRPVYLLEAEIRWVDDFLNELSSEVGPTPDVPEDS